MDIVFLWRKQRPDVYKEFEPYWLKFLCDLPRLGVTDAKFYIHKHTVQGVAWVGRRKIKVFEGSVEPWGIILRGLGGLKAEIPCRTGHTLYGALQGAKPRILALLGAKNTLF